MRPEQEEGSLDTLMAELLADEMTAGELRKWCRHHGVTRERGDSKMETARRAVEQNPVAVSRRVLETPDRIGDGSIGST